MALYALVGLSGAGKTHLLRYTLANSKGCITQLIATTTRKPRDGEINGRDKYFLSTIEFNDLRSSMICIHRMYGQLYGFYANDLDLIKLGADRSIIVELYYSDVFRIKRMGYKVKTILISAKGKERRLILHDRYPNKSEFKKRVIADFFCGIVLSLLKMLGIFDFEILNTYDNSSELKLLQFVEADKNVSC